MRDVMTEWRTQADGDLEDTETLGGLNIGQAPILGWPYAIHVPEQDASGDTLTITWQESANGSTGWRTFTSTPPVVTGDGAASAPIDLIGSLNNNLPFVRPVLTVTGGTPNFGAVTVGLDLGARRNAIQIGDMVAP